MLGIWLVTQMLLFNFGSSSLTSYRPLPLEFYERYLYPLLLPSVLLCSGWLTLLSRQSDVPRLASERRFWATIVAAGIVITVAVSLKDLRSHPLQMIQHVADRLKPTDTVYADFYTAQFLAFFAHNQILNADELAQAKPITPYETLKAYEMQSGAYVVINARNLDFSVSRQGTSKYKAPTFYVQHPSSWKLVSEERGVTLFKIEETSGDSAAKGDSSAPR
jgi:hypothetical protein